MYSTSFIALLWTSLTPLDAVSFWGYDLAKSIVRRFSSDVPSSTLTIAQIYFAGFLSAIPMNIIATPFDRVKVLLQTQGQTSPIDSKAPKYTGSMDVVRRLYRRGGLRSIYKGAAITFVRDGLDSAAYFATYEYCKRRLAYKDLDGNEGPLNLVAVAIAGAAAGTVMVIPLFPIDTVKSRLQNAENKTRVTELVCEVYRNGGLKAFYPGIGPALVRAIPANAATLLGWELANHAINKRFGP